MKTTTALLLAIGCTLLGCAAAAQKDVVDLDPTSFPKMLKSDRLWMVEFYAPWCGHCKQLAPEWAKAAGALKGVVSMGAVDMDKYQSLGAPYGITGFPTIKIFGGNKNKPTDYQGARQAKGLVDAGMKLVKDTVNARQGGGGSSGGGGGGGGGGKKSGSEVVTLTDSNFKKQVLEAKGIWLVEFYAPWCGHCKNLAPHWEKAAKQLKGQVQLGAVDATVHQKYAGQYGVQGYPTIKVFKNGKIDDYQGGRDTSSIVEYARQLYEANQPPPEVFELLEQKTFDSDCAGRQLCFLAFFPDIRDSDPTDYNHMINDMQANADTFKSRPFAWAWLRAGQQPALEQALDIGGAGYPAMVAVNTKKKKFAIHRGAFEARAIKDFVNQLVAGRAHTQPFKGDIPAIQAQTAWDGEAAAPLEDYEEEFDLSDLEDMDETAHEEL